MVFILYQNKKLFQMLNDLSLNVSELEIHDNSELEYKYKYAISENQVTDTLLVDDALSNKCNLVIYLFFVNYGSVVNYNSVNSTVKFMNPLKVAQMIDSRIDSRVYFNDKIDNIVSVSYVCSMYDAQVLFLGVHQDSESVNTLRKLLDEKLSKILKIENDYYKDSDTDYIDEAFERVNTNINYIASLMTKKKEG